MHTRSLAFALTALIWISPLWAEQPVALQPDHPDRYTVVPGDTLWDISARFLRDPWLWPEVWHVNPQIENPHLIYPGDVISLAYIDGRPRLQVERGRRTVKLSPQARPQPLDRAIPTIPIDAVQQFLTRPYVVEADTLKKAPYIVHIADEHIAAGADHRVYVRNVPADSGKRFVIVREGKPYRDPDTNEVLGHEAIYVGDALLVRSGEETATMDITAAQREVLIGDRLLPATEDVIDQNFLPHAPPEGFAGRIISAFDAVSQIGQFQVVVLNRGSADGTEVGHVLEVYQAGQRVRDSVAGGSRKTVQLPDERAGLVMVFRTFDRVSFGLIMQANRAIHIHDMVRTPEI